MPRYRLRTLLILLAIGPPVLAMGWMATASIIGAVVFVAAVALLSNCVIRLNSPLKFPLG
jgi:hypothetical protein